MARALPRYQPFNPRSVDVYGIGAGLLNDNFDPIALMDERYRQQLELDKEQEAAADRERQKQIEAKVAEEGGSIEDMLARAEQEYLAQGDFTGAFNLSQRRRQLEPDPMEEAKQMAALYKSAQDIAAVDPSGGLQMLNQFRQRAGQSPLDSIPQPSKTQFTSDFGAVRVFDDGRIERVPGFGPVMKPEKEKPLNLKDVMAFEFGIDSINDIQDPVRKAEVISRLSPEDRRLVTGGTGASVVRETGRPKATVEQAQQIALRKSGGKKRYTDKEIDKLRSMGLVE